MINSFTVWFLFFFLAEESAGNNGQEASSTTGESEEFLRKCGFEFPTKESCAEANNVGNHVLVQSVNETVNQSSELFDQPSEIVCDSSKGFPPFLFIHLNLDFSR